MAKVKRKKQRAAIDHDIPTAQSAGRDIQRAGRGYRFRPIIDTMREADKLTDAEWLALAYYRDQATLAERSCLRSCIDFSVSGGGDNRPSAAVASAMLETARIERDLGQLRDIARRVAVDDWSLSKWCIEQHGGRERLDSEGKCVAIVPFAEKRNMGIALIEIKMAAHRIVR